MIERVIENWLINAGEREFEVPLTQVLAVEGHEILQGPVHHAHEQGKDIITRRREGEIWALQLKSGNIDLDRLSSIEGQLWALSHSPIRHPALHSSTRATRVFLVTNGELTPPARAQLNDISAQNKIDGVAPIEYIERERLHGMFVRAHGRFLPNEPADMRRFLELYLDEGKGPLPKQPFWDFIDGVLPLNPGPKRLARSLSSAVLLCSYALSSWTRAGNHISVAEGWLLLAGSILRLTSVARAVQPRYWKTSYRLAMESARLALKKLLDEALASADLVVGDLADPLVYSSRALFTCGYSAALSLSELIEYGDKALLQEATRLCSRELPYANAVGEAGAPHLFMMALVLQLSGRIAGGADLIKDWAQHLADANVPHSEVSLADPYHSLDEILYDMAGAGEDAISEAFSGMAYTLHASTEWLARRGERERLAAIWPAVSRVCFHEYTPTHFGYLLPKDDTGHLRTWLPTPNQSWAALQRAAKVLRQNAIPEVLWSNPEYLPFVALLFPFRLTSDLLKALDRVLDMAPVSLEREEAAMA